MGAVWVKPRPTLSHLAIRVKAKLLVSRSCLEMMILNFPGLFGCAPVIRTRVLMDPVGKWGFPITSGRRRSHGALPVLSLHPSPSDREIIFCFWHEEEVKPGHIRRVLGLGKLHGSKWAQTHLPWGVIDWVRPWIHKYLSHGVSISLTGESDPWDHPGIGPAEFLADN